MKTHTHTRFTFTIPGTEIEVELPIVPDCVMDYKEPLVKITDDSIILGYLAHDDDCENPLENDDGLGHIYSGSYRNTGSLAEYCKALGLTTDGGPDFGLIDEEEVVKEAIERILADPALRGVVREELPEDCPALPGEHFDDYVKRCLTTLDDVGGFIDTNVLLQELWQQGRRDSTIGNPYAVLLDVYEHGGISYSLSGQGMQCQFDTARGGAVWVPNETCVDEIKRRGAVYRKGDVNELRDGTFEVKTLREDLLGYDDTVRPHFQHWYQAFELLSQLEPQHQRDLATAEQIAARELAKQAADIYTDWCNGNCFGVVVVTYDKGAWTDGQTLGEILNEDAVWGFVGDDYAYEALKSDYFPKDA